MKNSELIHISEEEISDLESLIRMQYKIHGEFSNLFLAELKYYELVYGVNYAQIIQSILDLESGIFESGTKEATQFRKEPLKGLWHKHYFIGRFIPKNIQIAVPRKQMEKRVRKVLSAYPDKDLTYQDKIAISSKIATELVSTPFEKRKDSSKLTGEWIVYAKDKQKNYYLCLANHLDGDEYIYDKIVTHCISEKLIIEKAKSVEQL